MLQAALAPDGRAAARCGRLMRGAVCSCPVCLVWLAHPHARTGTPLSVFLTAGFAGIGFAIIPTAMVPSPGCAVSARRFACVAGHSALGRAERNGSPSPDLAVH
jgi:hypothetical protein